MSINDHGARVPAPAGIMILVGMTREARIVGSRARVAVGRDGLARALAQGRPAAILSFGICGALDRDLEIGDLVIADTVNGLAADADWSARLAQALPTARIGPFAAGNSITADAAAKASLHRQTGAIAVDMESHFAAASGIPFAVLRAVSDTADQSLPPAARVGLKPDGRPDIPAVLRSLLADPRQLPALIRTARDVEIAYGALRYALDLAGSGFGRLDLGEHFIDVG